MMKNVDVHIRHERPEEYFTVENLVREAFWDVYKPGCDEHLLTHLLRTHPAYLPELSFVAETDGEICGLIQYSQAEIRRSDGSVFPVLTFGPLAVHPQCQNLGIGSRLVAHSMAPARRSGCAGIVIYGNPAYYGRFGFEPAERCQLADGEGKFIPALQLLPFAIEANFSGRFFESEVFNLDRAQVAAFDRRFPAKEKHVLPTQLFKE